MEYNSRVLCGVSHSENMKYFKDANTVIPVLLNQHCQLHSISYKSYSTGLG